MSVSWPSLQESWRDIEHRICFIFYTFLTLYAAHIASNADNGRGRLDLEVGDTPAGVLFLAYSISVFLMGLRLYALHHIYNEPSYQIFTIPLLASHLCKDRLLRRGI